MSGDPRGDEDREPEFRADGRAPAKKSMAEFLADFERRLKSHPDLPATGALRLVEERAAGLRRSPFEGAPTVSEEVASPEEAASETATRGPEAAGAQPPVPALGGVSEETAETDPAAPEPENAAASSGELRRLRGRRRRKHRHRAH